MTKPPPQTKESIQKELDREQTAKLILEAGQIAAVVVNSHPPPDAIFLVGKIVGFAIGNLVKPEPEMVNLVLADIFEDIRRTVINTIRTKQIAEAAEAKAAAEGKSDGQVQ